MHLTRSKNNHKIASFLLIIILLSCTVWADGFSDDIATVEGDSPQPDFTNPDNFRDALTNNPDQAVAFINSGGALPAGFPASELPPNILNQLNGPALDNLVSDLTTSQISQLSPTSLNEISTDSLHNIFDKLNANQIAQLNQQQTQKLTSDELKQAFTQLAPAQVQSFVNKLTDTQVTDYVQANPDLSDMPEQMADKSSQIPSP